MKPERIQKKPWLLCCVIAHPTNVETQLNEGGRKPPNTRAVKIKTSTLLENVLSPSQDLIALAVVTSFIYPLPFICPCSSCVYTKLAGPALLKDWQHSLFLSGVFGVLHSNLGRGSKQHRYVDFLQPLISRTKFWKTTTNLFIILWPNQMSIYTTCVFKVLVVLTWFLRHVLSHLFMVTTTKV